MTKAEWFEYLTSFDDATIYQTWSYGAVRWGEDSLSHVVIKQGNNIIALAQATITKLPVVGTGIAYIPWGPIWKRKNLEKDYEHFRRIIHSLQHEYVKKRHLLLRLAPNEIDDDAMIRTILDSEGFQCTAKPYRTYHIDLTQSEDELHKGMARRWRRALKGAEKENLKILSGTDDELYCMYLNLYNDMHDRKKFEEGVDPNEFRLIQKNLPQDIKMHILICEFENKPIASLMASLIGSTGVGLLGATATEGLNLGGFHLLNWRMIQWLKECGALIYDFGGYDPEKNPGTASFKDGLPGRDLYHIGHFEACENTLSELTVKWGQRYKDYKAKKAENIKK